MTSSVIYYSTDARKNEIYLLNNEYIWAKSENLDRIFIQRPLDFSISKVFFKIVLLLIIRIILTNKDGSSVFLLTKIEKHYYLPQNYHDAEMYLDIETDNAHCRYYMKIYISY